MTVIITEKLACSTAIDIKRNINKFTKPLTAPILPYKSTYTFRCALGINLVDYVSTTDGVVMIIFAKIHSLLLNGGNRDSFSLCTKPSQAPHKPHTHGWFS